MVEVSGLTVRNVAALVSLDEALGENLLGLSFLSRLRRFEHSIGLIVLEQLVLSPAAAMGYVLCAGRQPERHDVSQAQARARPQHLCV